MPAQVLREPDTETDALARQVIGAAIEVHRLLGPGYLESVYEEALAIELRLRGIAFARQSPVSLDYKGYSIGEGRLDFLIGGALIVEIKAVDHLMAIHVAQLMSYLKSARLALGLLINFNTLVLKDQIKRIVRGSPD